jgi:hypothetical protein
VQKKLPPLNLRQPRVYEVSRSGGYELSFGAENWLAAKARRQDSWLAKRSNLGMAMLGVVVISILLLPVSSKWRCLVLFPVEFPARLYLGLPRLRKARAAGMATDTLMTADDLVRLCAWLAILGSLALAVAMSRAQADANEEPVELFEGLSVWPTEVLRWLACLLSGFFILQAYKKLAKRDEDINRVNGFTRNPCPQERTWWHRIRDELLAPFTMWFFWHPQEQQLENEWQRFLRYANVWRRVWRCLIIGSLYLVLFKILDVLFVHSSAEARGPITRNVDDLMRWLSSICQVGLLVFVVDCTVLSYRFVRYLSSDRVKELTWPHGVLGQVGAERGIDVNAASTAGPLKQGLQHLLVLRLIDDATRVVAGLIYKPYIVLLVLLVAQSRLFENWHWNMPLILTVLLSAATAFCCAMMLQRAARGARQAALEDVEKLSLSQVGGADTATRKRLKRMRADIEAMRSGAFASFYDNPAIRAILIPLCGGGGLAALEAIATYL